MLESPRGGCISARKQHQQELAGDLIFILITESKVSVVFVYTDLICDPQRDEQVAQVQPALEHQVKVILLSFVSGLDREQCQRVLQSTVNVPETKFIF